MNTRILRADDKVEIQFARYHTHVTGEDPHNPKFKEDLEKGIMEMKWYDATDICVRGCWGKVHYGWDGDPHYGAWARVCQERTGFRRCRFVSEVVPLELEGQAVIFAGAVAFDVQGEHSPNVILNVHGSRTVSTCIEVGLTKEYVRPEYDFHFTYYPVSFGLPDGQVFDGYEFMTGIAHFKVFPSLVNYGGRMIFEFVSPVGYDEQTRGLTIGILDSTQVDVRALQAKNGITDSEVATRRKRVAAGTEFARIKKHAIVEALAAKPGVHVDCSQSRTGFDRGEKRVTMYPSWIGIGTPPANAKVNADKLTQLLGQFDIFRYQGHIDHYDFATGQFLMSASDRKEWEIISGKAKDVIFAGGPHHAFLTKLRSQPDAELPKIIAEGIDEMTWERITDNFVHYVREAKAICPTFSILQMPYELDNASDSEESKDIHYRFYQCCYRAADVVNAGLESSQQMRVAGPSTNTFNTGRWMGWMDGFLKRYAADSDPRKRLDFLTYHCYLFPPVVPKIPVGQGAHIRRLLTQYSLDPNLPVIIDESGIAEFSVPDEYMDLVQFSWKQLASATWLLALQHWFMQEPHPFHPITGDGWHFGSLCIGKQGALTHRAKAMLLRAKLDDRLLKSEAQPQTAEEGYGLYSMATSGPDRISVLVWSCSPGTFLTGLLPTRYPGTEIVVSNLPAEMAGRAARLTIHRLDMQHSNEERVLSSPKCQKLQKIDRQRYSIDFTPEEVADLDHIDSVTSDVKIPAGGEFRTTLDVEEHGIYLVEIEAMS